jgi:predicted dehydrogenase
MPEWKRRRSTGGGVLLDLASHHVDLARWFLRDEVREVRARLSSETTEHDTAELLLAMRGGCTVQSFFSFRSARADWLEFLGEKGTLSVDRHTASLSLQLARRFGYGVRRTWLLPSPAVARWKLARLLRPSYESSYRRALTAFVETLGGGPPRCATLEDGVANLVTILAAEESAFTGRPVTIEPT